MFYKVTLSKGEQREQIIVREVRLLQNNVNILRHADPEIFPEYMHDNIVFVSKDLSAMILPDSPITITEIKPTDEEPVEVKPVF